MLKMKKKLIKINPDSYLLNKSSSFMQIKLKIDCWWEIYYSSFFFLESLGNGFPDLSVEEVNGLLSECGDLVLAVSNSHTHKESVFNGGLFALL